MAKDLCLLRGVCTHPVCLYLASLSVLGLHTELGLQTLALQPSYTLPNGNGSTAALEVTSAPVTALDSGDGYKGWLYLKYSNGF